MRLNCDCIAVLALAWLALGIVGCNSQYAARQRLTREATSVTKETADLLATVKDQASALAAANKLAELTDRMERITGRLEALDTENEIYLGADEQRVLQDHGEWVAQQMRLMQQQLRIGQIPEARAALGETWIRLTGGAFDPGGIIASEMGLSKSVSPEPPAGSPATSNQGVSP